MLVFANYGHFTQAEIMRLLFNYIKSGKNTSQTMQGTNINGKHIYPSDSQKL